MKTSILAVFMLVLSLLLLSTCGNWWGNGVEQELPEEERGKRKECSPHLR